MYSWKLLMAQRIQVEADDMWFVANDVNQYYGC